METSADAQSTTELGIGSVLAVVRGLFSALLTHFLSSHAMGGPEEIVSRWNDQAFKGAVS